MSYNGQLNFGLNADYDALADLEALADELRASIEELAAAAGADADDGRPRPGHARSTGVSDPPPESSCSMHRRSSALAIVRRLAAAVDRADRAALRGFFAGRDRPASRGSTAQIGVAFRDSGQRPPQARSACTPATTRTRPRAARTSPRPMQHERAQLN